MTKTVEVTAAVKNFGCFCAVDTVSFSLSAGEIAVFLGPNGAGKTTILKMIMGILAASSGSIHIMGMRQHPNNQQIKPKLGYMSQKYSLYQHLTAFENLDFVAGVHGLPKSEITAVKETMIARFGRNNLEQPVQRLASGMRQTVALGICLLHHPKIILLDEPTSGVDPDQRRSFWREIYQLKQAGKTILITSHYLDEAEYANRLLIIHQGRIVLDGEPQSCKEQFQAATIETVFLEAIRVGTTS